MTRHREGYHLREDEFVLSTDEKTSSPSRIRKHATLPPRPGDPPLAISSTSMRAGRRRAYRAAMDAPFLHFAWRLKTMRCRNFDRTYSGKTHRPRRPADTSTNETGMPSRGRRFFSEPASRICATKLW
jgi:hypothetical protein